MDERIAGLGINTARLARRCTQLLAVPRDGWSFEEEGYIDGRRLAQLISSPSGAAVPQGTILPQADCLVTFSSIAPAP
jgi:cobaltochelatase CobT